jgi:hypothetical protein|tara:strand:+ start:25 stop:486 length:462 start_codon:yes stop_codon:yes gene_type:complete
MALKPDRVEHYTDLSFFMNETAERGIMCTHNTGGSGAAMDDSAAVVRVATSDTQNPAGLLLNDVVNIDLTRQHLNYHQDEVQIGSKVLLLRQGTVVTDQISGTPVVGEAVHFCNDGRLTTSSEDSASDPVGRWLSVLANGYAKCEINIGGAAS